ncbi:HAD-IA family hydrolase [Thermosulfuriphilus sp.]
MGHIYARILDRRGIKAEPEILNERFRQAWQKWRPHLRRIPSPRNCYLIWKQIFLETVAGLASDETLEEAFKEGYQAFGRRESFRLAPGIHGVLDYLRARSISLAIVSNWDRRLQDLINHWGLKDYFSLVITACEARVAKPDPRILKLACRRLGIHPQEALFIGDDPEEDLKAAQGVGMKAVLYLKDQDLLKAIKKFF